MPTMAGGAAPGLGQSTATWVTLSIAWCTGVLLVRWMTIEAAVDRRALPVRLGLQHPKLRPTPLASSRALGGYQVT